MKVPYFSNGANLKQHDKGLSSKVVDTSAYLNKENINFSFSPVGIEVVVVGFEVNLVVNLSGRSLLNMGVVDLLVDVVDLIVNLKGCSLVGMGVVGALVGFVELDLVVNLSGSSLVGMGVVVIFTGSFNSIIIKRYYSLDYGLLNNNHSFISYCFLKKTKANIFI